MMIHKGKERRKEDRIHAVHLPAVLKNVHVDIGSGNVVDGQVLDISYKGMGLAARASTKDINSIFITVSTKDQEISVKEQILATRSLDDSTSRIGIMFRQKNPFYTLM